MTSFTMDPTLHWRAAMERAATLKLPQGNEFFFAYQRPDGTSATAVGSCYAVLRIDGHHPPASLREYTVRNRPDPSPAALDSVFKNKIAPAEGPLTVAAWRELVGPPAVPTATAEKQVKCKECRGLCVVECPHCEQDMDCEECDGTGKVTEGGHDERPECEPILVAGVKIDPRMTAVLVSLLPDGPVTVGTMSSGAILRIDGDGWAMLQMGMTK